MGQANSGEHHSASQEQILVVLGFFSIPLSYPYHDSKFSITGIITFFFFKTAADILLFFSEIPQVFNMAFWQF